jgi:hypothetical protein
MQIIYRAMDGKEFDNQLDCQHHELHLQQRIVMLNHNGEQVHETSRAYLVWLKDVEANLAFHAMARAENDNFVKSIIEGEDYGLFYWDEGYDEYRWIDPDMVEGLVKMKQIIEERGGSL